MDFPFPKDEELFPETPERAFARSIMRPLYHLIMRGEDSMANITLLLGPMWQKDGSMWCHFICRMLVLMDPEWGSVPFRAAQVFYDAPPRLRISSEEEEIIKDGLVWGSTQKEVESVDTAPSMGLIQEEDCMDYTPSPQLESMETTPRLRPRKEQESTTETAGRKWDPRPANEQEGVYLRMIKWGGSDNGFRAAPAPMVDF